LIPLLLQSSLFPYTTLFRSHVVQEPSHRQICGILSSVRDGVAVDVRPDLFCEVQEAEGDVVGKSPPARCSASMFTILTMCWMSMGSVGSSRRFFTAFASSFSNAASTHLWIIFISASAASDPSLSWRCFALFATD